jgi:hypothetical protein
VPQRLRSLFEQPDRLARMQQQAWALGCRDGGAKVSELALDMARAQMIRSRRPLLRSQEH